MTYQSVSPVEAAYRRARASRLPLNERLKMVADVLRVERPDYMSAVDSFVGRLNLIEARLRGPMIGEAMPSFELPDQDGRLVSLLELLDGGPLAIIFHRGHWCPFCRLQLQALAQVERSMQPARIVAISAQLQRDGRNAREIAGAHFPFLTDFHAGYILSLGLAVWLDEVLAEMIAGVGIDISRIQGNSGWILPIPSVFVLDREGIVRARHVDPDFRRRMDLDDLIAELGKLVSRSS